MHYFHLCRCATLHPFTKWRVWGWSSLCIFHTSQQANFPLTYTKRTYYNGKYTYYFTAKGINMTDPNFVLMYVDSPPASAAFYTELLGHAPVESSPTFALFALSSGVMLGFWSRHTVEPAATILPGAVELAFALDDIDAVQAIFSDWTQRGLPILQQPTYLDFGFTFVAQDPDGHRLRVFTPIEN